MRLTDEEIQARRSHIGGSEAAAVLGLSKWKTPEQVRQEKLGIAPAWDGNLRTELGHVLEPMVLGLYEKEIGKPLVQVPARTSGIMLATPDAMVDERWGVDAKTAGQKNEEWGEPDSDEIPAEYVLQGQHYMAVTGATRWDFAVLFLARAEFSVYTVERDPKLIDLLSEREGAWWQAHIVEGKPCPAVSLDDLKLLYPRDDGSLLEATAEDIARIATLRELKGELKELEEQKDELETYLRMRLGAHAGLLWQGKPAVTYKAQRGSRLDAKRLKAEKPEVAKAYTVRYDMRVLRVKS